MLADYIASGDITTGEFYRIEREVRDRLVSPPIPDKKRHPRDYTRMRIAYNELAKSGRELYMAHIDISLDHGEYGTALALADSIAYLDKWTRRCQSDTATRYACAMAAYRREKARGQTTVDVQQQADGVQRADLRQQGGGAVRAGA